MITSGLPSLIQPLGASQESIGLILSVFTLFVVLFTPILGALSDRLKRKTVLVPVVFLYGLAGLLMVFTTNFTVILALRALQGIAVAGMASLAVTMIGDLYTGKERAQAVGYRSSVHSIGFAIFPFVAGALATLNLFYPFYVFALAIPLSLVAWVKLEEPEIGDHHTWLEYGKDMMVVLKQKQTLARG